MGCIPTCAGIAPTKTLAKLCDHFAKTYPVFDGVVNWLELSESRRKKAMSITPIKEVWGIGNRTREILEAMGVRTVLDFAGMDAALVRRRFGVVLERTHREINGVSCIPLEEIAPERQQIVRTRSFAQTCSDINSLRAAVSVHMADAVRTLRLQKSASGTVGVLFHSDPFKTNVPHHAVFEFDRLPHACADVLTLPKRPWNWSIATIRPASNTRKPASFSPIWSRQAIRLYVILFLTGKRCRSATARARSGGA